MSSTTPWFSLISTRTLTPPKVLVIGPDSAGNLVEVIWLDLSDDVLVIHAMTLRPLFYDLLPAQEDPTS